MRQILGKTQAHEVVVPWQHQAVSEEEAYAGKNEEPVDVIGGGDTGAMSFAMVTDTGKGGAYRSRCLVGKFPRIPIVTVRYAYIYLVCFSVLRCNNV